MKDGRVATRGWVTTADTAPGPFTKALAERGILRILCTAVSRDGTLKGPDEAVLREVSGHGVAVIASGGVGVLSHLESLAKLADVESVVVGKALVTGVFTYAEAQSVC